MERHRPLAPVADLFVRCPSHAVDFMTAEWEALRKTPVEMQTLETRSKLLSDFLREHGLGEPKSVEYSPLVGCVQAYCFTNVEAQIARSGGTLESGWAF